MSWRAAAGLVLPLALTACSRNEARSTVTPPRDPGAHTASAAAGPPVLLARGKQASTVIVAPARLFDGVEEPSSGKKPRKPRLSPEQKQARAEAQKLLAAVTDLARYLSKISGAEVTVVKDSDQPGRGLTPILIGELGERRFGPVGVKALGRQGFRLVTRREAIGLYGESDLATGYAIYELLDRLGCRWFMPGELGEVVPRQDELSVPVTDESLAPSTLYRDIWYADQDFKRRNRLGGVQVAAGHMLEKWISAAERDEHPQWRAVVKGSPHASRLRWSNPELAPAIANGIRARLAKKPAGSVSISPADGTDFDDTFDTALDAKDWDPSTNGVSLTDRLLVLANGVATDLSKDHPDLLLGMLAYVSYTRPPVREKVHPNVVPVLAPITYCRQHPLSDDACPGAKDLRNTVVGWSAHAERLAFRGYAFNLAEPAAPNPMLRKWSYDLPFLFSHKVRFFQPETLANFETSLPALYLGIRLSWNSQQAPAAVSNELFERFYGHAGKAVRVYTDTIDRAWTDSPEFGGGGLGYGRRFPPELLRKARSQMEQAKQACESEQERERVGMLDQSLAQLELYMRMDSALTTGKVTALHADYQRWQAKAGELAEKYAANFAFGKARWAGDNGVYANYVKRFLEPIYVEADRIQREQVVLTAAPLCNARYRLAPSAQPPLSDVPATLGDAEPTMNVCTSTWSSIGQSDYFGAMWYQAEFDVGVLPAGKRAFLWLSKVDGLAQAWLNDVPLPLKGAADRASFSAEVHLKALTFEATAALQPGAKNTLKVLARRTRLAELGAGGLLGPAYLYRDR